LPFGLFYGQLVYFMTIWSIFWSFGIFCPVLVCCTKKNLATLARKGGRGAMEKPIEMERGKKASRRKLARFAEGGGCARRAVKRTSLAPEMKT
jgi:hypothetical protein